MMRPFFTYFGGKYRIAPRYPKPIYRAIVEPFAGSAGYAVRYPELNVHLYDLDEKICGTWEYLICTPADEIRKLPLYDGTWSTVNDLDISQEARWLIGWWLNKGAASPRLSPSAWMRAGTHLDSYWGPVIRERIASQVDSIRHWRVYRADYHEAPLTEATWFVDPPYQNAGNLYRNSANKINYADLAEWCKTIPGQVIVCEAEGSDWLPFVPFTIAKASPSSRGGKKSAEVVWLSHLNFPRLGECDINPLRTKPTLVEAFGETWVL